MGFSIAKELSTMSLEQRMSIEVNLAQLFKRSRELGYTFFKVRDDSKLAFMWSTYSFPCSSEEEIVHEMALTQYLYSDPLYSNELETSLRRIADEVKKKYRRLTWSDVWTLVREFGPDLIRASIAHRKGGFPQLSNRLVVREESWPFAVHGALT